MAKRGSEANEDAKRMKKKYNKKQKKIKEKEERTNAKQQSLVKSSQEKDEI